jgi:hypothetical protein
VRQRNDTANALHVSAWPTDDDPDRRPFDVAPGEETDFPQLLAGFTSLEPPAAESDAAQGETPAPKAKARAKAADTSAPEGGEPQ